jgi:hypothetical protein
MALVPGFRSLRRLSRLLPAIRGGVAASMAVGILSSSMATAPNPIPGSAVVDRGLMVDGGAIIDRVRLQSATSLSESKVLTQRQSWQLAPATSTASSNAETNKRTYYIGTASSSASASGATTATNIQLGTATSTVEANTETNKRTYYIGTASSSASASVVTPRLTIPLGSATSGGYGTTLGVTRNLSSAISTATATPIAGKGIIRLGTATSTVEANAEANKRTYYIGTASSAASANAGQLTEPPTAGRGLPAKAFVDGCMWVDGGAFVDFAGARPLMVDTPGLMRVDSGVGTDLRSRITPCPASSLASATPLSQTRNVVLGTATSTVTAGATQPLQVVQLGTATSTAVANTEFNRRTYYIGSASSTVNANALTSKSTWQLGSATASASGSSIILAARTSVRIDHAILPRLIVEPIVREPVYVRVASDPTTAWKNPHRNQLGNYGPLGAILGQITDSLERTLQRPYFPGGVLIGDGASVDQGLRVPKIVSELRGGDPLKFLEDDGSIPTEPSSLSLTGMERGIFAKWFTPPEKDLVFAEVQASTTPDFTFGTITEVRSATGSAVITNLAYDTDYHVRIRHVDLAGNRSPWSAVSIGRALRISAQDIQDSTITAAKLGVNSVTATQIAPNSITTGKIFVGAVTANEISTGAVTTVKLAAGAVTTPTIAAGAITTSTIAAGAITAAVIGAGEVRAVHIGAAQIEAVHIAAAVIDASKIVAGSISTNQLAVGGVTAATIADLAVLESKIGTAAVNQRAIATDAVVSTKIAAGAIIAGKIAAGVITANEIAASTITGGQIAADTINTTHIAAGAITANELAAGSVTANAVLANSIDASKINGDIISGRTISGNTITGAVISGSTIRTATAGTYVALESGDTDTVRFYTGQGDWAEINAVSDRLQLRSPAGQGGNSYLELYSSGFSGGQSRIVMNTSSVQMLGNAAVSGTLSAGQLFTGGLIAGQNPNTGVLFAPRLRMASGNECWLDWNGSNAFIVIDGVVTLQIT